MKLLLKFGETTYKYWATLNREIISRSLVNEKNSLPTVEKQNETSKWPNTKGTFPNDNSLSKLLYLRHVNVKENGQ